MSTTAVVIARSNRIIRAFRRAGATSPGTAKTLEEIGCGRRGLSFHKLARRGVLVEASEGRYYLDEDAVEEFQAYRRVVFLLALAVAVVAIGVLLYRNVR